MKWNLKKEINMITITRKDLVVAVTLPSFGSLFPSYLTGHFFSVTTDNFSILPQPLTVKQHQCSVLVHFGSLIFAPYYGDLIHCWVPHNAHMPMINKFIFSQTSPLKSPSTCPSTHSKPPFECPTDTVNLTFLKVS